MNIHSVCFEVKYIDTLGQIELIEHIYRQAMAQYCVDGILLCRQPIMMLCDSIRMTFDIRIEVEIDKEQALVEIYFFPSMEFRKRQQITKRVYHIFKTLLNAQVKVIAGCRH